MGCDRWQGVGRGVGAHVDARLGHAVLKRQAVREAVEHRGVGGPNFLGLGSREGDLVAEPVGHAVHDDRDPEEKNHAAVAQPYAADKDQEHREQDHPEGRFQLVHPT